MAWVGRLGKGLNDPTILNPRRARRAMRRIRHPASREVQNRLAWGYLGQFLGQQTKR